MATPATHDDRDPDDLPADPDDLPGDPIDQELVAYLDGELDESERHQLEERLLADSGLRRRLSDLQSGWEMLDILPPATVTEDFARTTVELVAAGQSQLLAAQKQKSSWWRFGRTGVLVLITLAAGGMSYLYPGVVEQRQFEQQLEDLPLAAHLDAYLIEMDLEMVQRLANDRDWKDSMRLGRNAGGIIVPEPLQLASQEFPHRLQTVKSVDNNTRRMLAGNWDRLNSFPSARLDAIRQRAAEIQATEDPQRILETLDEFAVWYSQLTPEAQTRILQAKGDEKLEVIRNELQNSQKRWIRDFGSSLSGTDRDLIYERLKAFAETRIRTARAELASLPGDPQENRRSARWYEIKPVELLNFIAWPWRRGSRSSRSTADEAAEVELTESMIRDRLFDHWRDDELEDVTNIMSADAKLVLNAQANDINDKRRTLTRWCNEIVQQMSPYANNAETILKHYQYREGDSREILDLEPPSEIFNRLRGRGFGSNR